MEIKISDNLLKKIFWPVGLPFVLIPVLVEFMKEVDSEAVMFFLAFFGSAFSCAGALITGVFLLAGGFKLWLFLLFWAAVAIAWISLDHLFTEF